MPPIRSTAFILLVIISAAAKAMQPEDIFIAPENYEFTINPKGDLIAAITADEKSEYLIAAPTSTLKFELIAQFEKKYAHKYHWVDNDTLYYEYKLNYLGEKREFVSLRVGPSGITTSTLANHTVGFIVDPLLSEDNTVLYAKRDLSSWSNRLRLYKVPIDTLGQTETPKKYAFGKKLPYAFEYRADWETNDLFARSRKPEEEVLWRYNQNSLQWDEIYRRDVKDTDEFSPFGVLENGNIAVLTNMSTDTVSVVEFDPKTQNVVRHLYENEDYDVISATLNKHNKALRNVTYIHQGVVATHYFTNHDSSLISKLQKALPNKVLHVVDRSNAETSIISASSDHQAAEYYLFDEKSLKATLLASEFPSFDTHKFSKSTVVKAKNSAGNTIEGYLTTPRTGDNGVLLVVPHGGPVGVREMANFRQDVQLYASHGFTVLRINFRGSWGFGKSFMDSGREEFGKAIEDDITALVNEVRKSHGFKSACAMGGSYGAYSSVMLAIRQPEFYRCVVALYGVYDLPLLFNDFNFSQIEHNRKAIAHTVGEYNREELLKTSPFHLAEKLKAPILIIAGALDTTAAHEHSNRMHVRLKKLGKAVEYLTFDDVGHGTDNRRDLIREHNYVLDFLLRHLREEHL